MSWQDIFGQGVKHYKAGKHDKAVELFTEALAKGGDQNYAIYDSRAAAYEKLNKCQEALRDSKKTIETAKSQWQGYARAARLFQKSRRYDASIRMAGLAIERIKPDGIARRAELTHLKDETQRMKAEDESKLAEDRRLAAQEAEIERRRTRYHFGDLPIEVAVEVFSLLIEEDSAALIALLGACRRWRAVVWSTPALWDTLVLSKAKPCKKVKLWLSRSRGLVRNLVVRASVAADLDWSYHLLTPLKWEHLRICSVEDWDLAAFLKMISLHHILGKLHSLQVSATPMNDLFVENASLRSLSVMQELHSFPCALAANRLQHLTSLILHSTFQDDIFCLLGRNPLLETLVINPPVTRQAPSTPPDTPVLLSSLTRLEVMNWQGSVDLLAHIQCRNVTAFKVLGAGEDLTQPLRSFAQNSSPANLTHIVLHRTLTKSQPVIHLLHIAETLTHLELVGTSGLANAIAEALAAPANTKDQTSQGGDNPSVPMCPKLTYLDLSRSPDLKTGPLVRIVKHRNENSIPRCERIDALIVDECPLVDAQWLPYLRSHISTVSCIYLTKKAARKMRR